MPTPSTPSFRSPTMVERGLNRLLGVLFGLGLGLRHNYLLQVRGRKSGRIYSTPVNLLKSDRKLYLVCPRGRAQWVRNAEVSGLVLLKRRRTQEFRLRPVPDEQKPAILKEYLERYKTTVQRYFPVSSDSSPSAFAPYVARYPVFELRATGESQ